MYIIYIPGISVTFKVFQYTYAYCPLLVFDYTWGWPAFKLNICFMKYHHTNKYYDDSKLYVHRRLTSKGLEKYKVNYTTFIDWMKK